MAPSHLSGMEMRSLLFGVIFGLLAVVHSTPLTNVTQDEVLREAVTDGYLLVPGSPSSPTTESPKRNATVPASQQPASLVESLGSEDSESFGSGDSEFVGSRKSTTAEPEHAEGFPATALPEATDDSRSSETNETQSENDDVNLFSGDGESEDESATPVLPWHGGEHHAATTPSVFMELPVDARDLSLNFLSVQPSEGSGDEQGSGSGSGSGDTGLTTTTERTVNDTILVHPTPSEETSTASSTSVAGVVNRGKSRIFAAGIGSEDTDATTTAEKVENKTMIHVHQPPDKVHVTDKQTQEHGTPGWIIIVGFIVGLAALVMLCAAIATRDKWNGPQQASQVATKTNSANQQRELEMETFLHNDKPRENGKAADYTVVPLDDVPESYSSH